MAHAGACTCCAAPVSAGGAAWPPPPPPMLPMTPDTASRATALPVPKAKPCATVPEARHHAAAALLRSGRRRRRRPGRGRGARSSGDGAPAAAGARRERPPPPLLGACAFHRWVAKIIYIMFINFSVPPRQQPAAGGGGKRFGERRKTRKDGERGEKYRRWRSERRGEFKRVRECVGARFDRRQRDGLTACWFDGVVERKKAVREKSRAGESA